MTSNKSVLFLLGVISLYILSTFRDVKGLDCSHEIFHYDLTKDQIQEYRDNGFIRLKSFFSPAIVKNLTVAVEEALLIRGKDWKFPQKGSVDTVNVEFEYYERVFTQRLNLWATNQKVKDFWECYGNEIGRVAAELEGVDGYRMWHDQALVKEPWSNPTSFHIDNPYWSFSSKHALSIWMALDHVEEQNGALYFVPGSQKIIGAKEDPFEEIKIGKNIGKFFDLQPQLKDMMAQVVRYEPGDVSFHNGLTVHGAMPNFTPNRRRAFTAGFMPLGSKFNGKKNILTEEEMAKYRVGDELNDLKINPLLYPKVEFVEGLPNLPEAFKEKADL